MQTSGSALSLPGSPPRINTPRERMLPPVPGGNGTTVHDRLYNRHTVVSSRAVDWLERNAQPPTEWHARSFSQLSNLARSNATLIRTNSSVSMRSTSSTAAPAEVEGGRAWKMPHVRLYHTPLSRAAAWPTFGARLHETPKAWQGGLNGGLWGGPRPGERRR